MMRSIRGVRGAAAVVLLSMWGVWGSVCQVEAATFVVSTVNDSGANSLRQAVADANGNADPDNSIYFSGALSGTITLTSGELLITKSLAVIGPGPDVLTLSGNNASRVFHVEGTDFTITLRGLTIRNGKGYDNGQSKYDVGGGIYIFGGGSHILLDNMVIENNVSGAGGGIYASGSYITMKDSTVRNNQVVSNSLVNSEGGGINFNGSNATITGSAIYGNTCDDQGGGGIRAWGGNLLITDSTISGNTAVSSFGGGIYAYNETVTLANVTMAYNQALSMGAGLYPGSNNGTHSTSITNSIFSHNTLSGSSELNCSFSLVVPISGGGNIDSGNTCGLVGAADHQNTDPSLGALGDNGGPTFYHGIIAGSQAVDAGVAAGALSVDQRGWPRPAGAAVDSGAVEYMESRVLTLNKTGSTGTGRVMSAPGGLDCGITCAGDASPFPLNGTVSLSAVPAGASIFSGWSGTGCGDLMTMTADRTCTASFTLCNGDPVQADPAVGSANNVSISAAYGAGMLQTQQIMVTASNRIEDLNLNRTVDLQLRGGYNCSFQNPPSGYTYVSGKVTISNSPGQTLGSVTMDRIIIL